MTVSSIEFKLLFKYWADIMKDNRDFLGEQDSIAGDGDLGLTMNDGFLAACNAAEACGETDAGKLCYTAGKAMSTAVPSTMGTLMASGLMEAGKALKGREELSLVDFADLFEAYLQGVASRGKAGRGEKTFLDGLGPAVDSLKADAAAKKTAAEAASNAAEAAKAGYEATVGMAAIHGRAAARGEQSRELHDPGAAVAMLLMEAFAMFCTIV